MREQKGDHHARSLLLRLFTRIARRATFGLGPHLAEDLHSVDRQSERQALHGLVAFRHVLPDSSTVQ